MNRWNKAATAAAAITIGSFSLIGMASPFVDGRELNGPRLVADLSDKILYVYEGDSVVDMYDIADGRDDYPTPRGEFRIRKLTWNPRWVPPESKWAENKTVKAPGHPQNPMKVVKIFFEEPDYYIHGTDDVATLGSSESHGCMRMAPDDVMKVGKWLMEHGGEPREENWFMRVLHSRREEKVVYLSKPVPITVQE